MNNPLLILLLYLAGSSETCFIPPNEAVSKPDYSSKAKSSNVRGVSTIFDTFLKLGRLFPYKFKNSCLPILYGTFWYHFWNLCEISVIVCKHGEDVNLNNFLFGACHRYSIGSSMMHDSFVASTAVRGHASMEQWFYRYFLVARNFANCWTN